MNSQPVTNATLQTTVGRITTLTELRMAETTTEMSNLWLKGSSSVLTDESPGIILRELTGSRHCAKPDMSNAQRARDRVAEQVSEVEPTLTQSLLDHVQLISQNVVKESPSEFVALKVAWEHNVISSHAGHVALERAAAVYPKLLPGERITFLADDLMNLDVTSQPEIEESLDDRFRFIVNHVRNERALEESFGLTRELVERSIEAGFLSTNPYAAIHKYSRRKSWLKIELGTTFVITASLIVGGFVSHSMGESVLRNILWILAWAPGMGFSSVSGERYLDNERSDLFAK